MEFGIPLGIVPAIKEWVERRLFLETYAVSHRSYLKRKALGNSWSQAGPYLQYSVSLANAQFNNDTSPAHRIAFRSSIELRNVQILVQGQSGNLVYEDAVQFSKMDVGNTYVARLVNVPPLSINAADDGTRISLASISVSLSHACDAEENPIKRSSYDRVTPTYFDLLNDRTVFKFGRWWNLGAIDREKHEIYLDSHTRYIWRPRFYKYGLPIRLLCSSAFFLTGSSFAVNIRFWAPIFLGTKFVPDTDPPEGPGAH